MPQMCKICTHPERAQIDLALGRGISGPQISKRHKVPIFSLYRHRKAHLSWELQAKLRAIGKPSEIDLEELRHTESEGLLQRVTWQRAKLHQLLEECERIGDIGNATRVHGRLLENFNLTGRLLGELAVSNRITINSLVATPEYMQLRGALFDVLRPHPEIRREVVRVLGRLEGQMTAVGGGLVQLDGKAATDGAAA